MSISDAVHVDTEFPKESEERQKSKEYIYRLRVDII